MTSLMKILRATLAISVLAACASVWTVAAAEPARVVVDNLDHQLIETMKQGQKLGFAGRYKQLAPVIDQSFDLPRIAHLALGPSWKKLDADQQKRYQAMFRKDTLATYAERFDRFDDQHFEILGTSDAAGGRRQVKTVIVSKNGDRIPINYVLDNEGGRWKIINVVARGASDLALKRAQYTSVIGDKGADGFLDQFQAQLKKYPALPES